MNKSAPFSSRWYLGLLLLLPASCSDSGEPVQPQPASVLEVSVSIEADGMGTSPPSSASLLRVRATGESGEELWSRTFGFSEPFPFVLGPQEVLSSRESVTIRAFEVEVLTFSGESTSPLWSGRADGFTFDPSSTRRDSRSVSVSLRPGALPNLDLSGVSIPDAPEELGVGETVLLTVSGSGGTPEGAFWGTLDPDLVSVSSSGAVTGISQGSARIIVAAGPVADTVSIQVRRLADSVELSPQALELTFLRELFFLSPTVRDFRGNELLDVPLEWASSDETVASVNQEGRVAALGAGTAQVTVSVRDAPDLVATSEVTVVQIPHRLDVSPSELVLLVGESASISTVVRDAGGSRIDGVSINFSVADPEILDVEAQGKIRALSPGSTAVTVEGGGLSRNVAVPVQPRLPASIQLISGGGQSALVGETLPNPIVVQVLDDLGSPVSGATVSWIAADGGSVAPGGSTTTGGDGRTSVSWRLGEVAGPQSLSAGVGELSLEVSATALPSSPSSIGVSPSSATLTTAGQTVQLSATAVDQFGNPIEISPTWTTSPSGVVTVSSSGLVTAVADGTAQVVATADGVSGSASITVSLLGSRTFQSSTQTEAQLSPASGIAFPSQWTYSMWVRPMDTSGSDFQFMVFTAGIFSGAPTFNVYFGEQSNGIPWWHLAIRTDQDNSFIGATPGHAPVEGSWTHLTVISDGSDVTLYEDGTALGTWPAPGTISPSSFLLGNGNEPAAAADQHFNGNIAQATRWAGVLTPGEVADLADGRHPLTIRESDLEWYVPLSGSTPEYTEIGPQGSSLSVNLVNSPTVGPPPPVDLPPLP